MGETTGFLKWERETPTRRPVPVRLHDWHEVYEPFPADKLAAAGRPLHGLRHPVLQQRLPARQPHPRLERPRLPRPLARRDRAPARHQQLPRVHRPAVPGAVRGGVRARHQPGSRHHQAGRGRDRRPRVGRGLDRARACRRCAPAARSRWSAPGPPGSRPRSSSRAPATRSWCSSAPTASAACCATASPSSRWRSATSTAGSTQMEAEGTEFRVNVNVGVDVSVERAARGVRRHRARRAAPPRGATCRSRAASSAGIHQAMEFLPWGNRVQQGDLDEPPITAEGKHVVIIGGGDTGADCLGTSHRQGAASVHQFEILPRPPDVACADQPVADVVEHLPGVVGARRGRRARLQRQHRVLPRRRRRQRARAARARGRDDRRQVREDRGHRLRAARASSCCSPWASSAPSARGCSSSSASSSTRAATWRATRRS